MEYSTLLHNLQIETQHHISKASFTADFIINDLVIQAVDEIGGFEIQYVVSSNANLHDKIAKKYKRISYSQMAAELVRSLTSDLQRYFSIHKKKAA